MDTEGFEGTGQAEVYDDRIFAFAALVSDVVVYNLAETIKQADIERLAFAAQLSHEFWRRANPAAGAGGASSVSRGDWQPPALLWLVQRDFLQGGSVEAYLRQALEPTAAGRKRDEHSQRLDQVREALNSCFGRMRAMGLVQPHVKRTQLCSLPRSSFDPDYLKGAAEVSSFVTEHSTPASADAAVVRGRSGRSGIDGRSLATLIERVIEALNLHEIPTAGSVVDAFNARLVQAAVSSIRDGLRQLELPLSQHALEAAHAALLAAAQETLREQSFGASRPDELTSAAGEALTALADANFVASQKACDGAWVACEMSVKSAGKHAWLPSTSRFAARVTACNSTMSACIGPAAARFHNELLPALAAEGAAEYTASYREQLHRFLVIASVGGVLISRLLLKSTVLELVCAIAFVGVELLPALLPFGYGSQWVWDSAYVHTAVGVYEAVVFNPLWDLERMLPVILVFCAVGCACRSTRVSSLCRHHYPTRRTTASWNSGRVEVVVARDMKDSKDI